MREAGDWDQAVLLAGEGGEVDVFCPMSLFIDAAAHVCRGSRVSGGGQVDVEVPPCVRRDGGNDGDDINLWL